MQCPVCGAATQAHQRFCMDCGNPLGQTYGPQTTALGAADVTGRVTVVPASGDPTTIVPLVTSAGTPGASPPAGSGTVSLSPTDPTTQIRIVEQTTTGPAVDWTSGASAPAVPQAQVWTPAPSLAPQPVTAGTVPFIEDAWHTAVDEGWRSGAPVFDPEPYDAAALTIFAVLAIVLGLVAMFTKLVTFDFGDGAARSFRIDDVSSNAIPTMIVVAIVLVLGGGLAIGRQRIGAGLAGGAGLALAGLVAVDVALAQSRIEALKLFVGEGQTLSITREVPYFILIAAGVCGLVVFLVSLPAARGDGRPRLNAAICSVGALAMLAVAAGPFLPGNGTTWGTNTDGGAFPSFVPWLRIGAMGLVVVAGVVGFANQRRWGVGVAVGGLAAVVVEWAGTLSTTPPAGRTGVGIASIGTTDGTPNLVITIGLIVAALAGLTAVLLDVGARRTR